MDFSKLPFDNLYKFVAISGLVVFIASIAAPLQFYHSVTLQKFTVEGEISALDVHFLEWQGKQIMSDALVEQQEKREAHIEVLKNAPEPDEEAIKKAKQELEAFHAKNDPHFHQTLEIARQVDEEKGLLAAQEARVKYLDRLSWIYIYIAIGGGIVGITMTGIGFYFWYQRVQKHEDRILATEARKAT